MLIFPYATWLSHMFNQHKITAVLSNHNTTSRNQFYHCLVFLCNHLFARTNQMHTSCLLVFLRFEVGSRSVASSYILHRCAATRPKGCTSTLLASHSAATCLQPDHHHVTLSQQSDRFTKLDAATNEYRLDEACIPVCPGMPSSWWRQADCLPVLVAALKEQLAAASRGFLSDGRLASTAGCQPHVVRGIVEGTVVAVRVEHLVVAPAQQLLQTDRYCNCQGTGFTTVTTLESHDHSSLPRARLMMPHHQSKEPCSCRYHHISAARSSDKLCCFLESAHPSILARRTPGSGTVSPSCMWYCGRRRTNRRTTAATPCRLVWLNAARLAEGEAAQSASRTCGRQHNGSPRECVQSPHSIRAAMQPSKAAG